ncbi:hypothetical protein CPB83DRAFT_865304 [Crepidotus variabilis]|uniref:Uncharacterized protein n=1 Tax=Crepidotus variabilis TaxID=179855 RepID=A0A9P6E3B4_9AGAR|nr:hypothetical protein CPB83DRAFT_865304 [Crepidotus variabilis]
MFTPTLPNEITKMIFEDIFHPAEQTPESLELQSSICLLSMGSRAMIQRNVPLNVNSDSDLDRLWTSVIEFDTVFREQPFSFGDATIIQLFIPEDPQDRRTADILARLPLIKHINVAFYEGTEWSKRFFGVLKRWAPLLLKVQIIRLKYKLFKYQLDSAGVESAWLSHQEWMDCINAFPGVRVILIDTPQLIINHGPRDEYGDVVIDRTVEEEWIRLWEKKLPNLQRVYLNHSYDDELGVGSGDLIGSRSVFQKKENGTFMSHLWRSVQHQDAFSVQKKHPLLPRIPQVRVKKEDLDYFDSEDEFDCKIDPKDYDNYVDMW